MICTGCRKWLLRLITRYLTMGIPTEYHLHSVTARNAEITIFYLFFSCDRREDRLHWILYDMILENWIEGKSNQASHPHHNQRI